MADAVGQITGTIPIVVAGGVTLGFMDAAFGNKGYAKKRRYTGNRPRRLPKGQCRSSKPRRTRGPGFGNFSNVGL